MTGKIITALTIAGSDCSGGAGIQADLKTFAALGLFGTCAITTVVSENTQAVYCREDINSEVLASQIEAVMRDIPPDAIKIGLLPTPETVKTVSECLKTWPRVPTVLDPVMVATSGDSLHGIGLIDALEEILPMADLVTPNLSEARALTGLPVDSRMERAAAAEKLCAKGARAVLIKGGHLSEDAEDLLFDGEKLVSFTAKRISTRNTHGTGCTLSSAIAGYLAKGFTLEQAIGKGKAYVTGAIENGLQLGKGSGPLDHFYRVGGRE